MVTLSASAPVAHDPSRVRGRATYAVEVDDAALALVEEARLRLLSRMKEHLALGLDNQAMQSCRLALLEADEARDVASLTKTLPRSFRNARSLFSRFLDMVAANQEKGEGTIAELRERWIAVEHGHSQFLAESHYYKKLPMVALYVRQFEFVRKCVQQAEMDRSTFVPTGLLAALSANPPSMDDAEGVVEAPPAVQHATPTKASPAAAAATAAAGAGAASSPSTPNPGMKRRVSFSDEAGSPFSSSPQRADPQAQQQQGSPQQQQQQQQTRRLSSPPPQSSALAVIPEVDPPGDVEHPAAIERPAAPPQLARRSSIVPPRALDDALLQDWIFKNKGYSDEHSRSIAVQEVKIADLLAARAEVDREVSAHSKREAILENEEVAMASMQCAAATKVLEGLLQEELEALAAVEENSNPEVAAERIHDLTFLRARRLKQLKNYANWLQGEIASKNDALAEFDMAGTAGAGADPATAVAEANVAELLAAIVKVNVTLANHPARDDILALEDVSLAAMSSTAAKMLLARLDVEHKEITEEGGEDSGDLIFLRARRLKELKNYANWLHAELTAKNDALAEWSGKGAAGGGPAPEA
jgi:hypothetical protein